MTLIPAQRRLNNGMKQKCEIKQHLDELYHERDDHPQLALAWELVISAKIEILEWVLEEKKACQ